MIGSFNPKISLFFAFLHEKEHPFRLYKKYYGRFFFCFKFIKRVVFRISFFIADFFFLLSCSCNNEIRLIYYEKKKKKKKRRDVILLNVERWHVVCLTAEHPEFNPEKQTMKLNGGFFCFIFPHSEAKKRKQSKEN